MNLLRKLFGCCRESLGRIDGDGGSAGGPIKACWQIKIQRRPLRTS
jgi:hypothetical protein